MSPPPLAIDTNGKVLTDTTSVLKLWRGVWSDITNPSQEEETIYDEGHKKEVEDRLDYLRSVRLSQQHFDKPITAQEVFTAIRKTKSGKAPGVDGVTTTILKMAADAVGTNKLKPDNPVVEALTLLFNYVFEHEGGQSSSQLASSFRYTNRTPDSFQVTIVPSPYYVL